MTRLKNTKLSLTGFLIFLSLFCYSQNDNLPKDYSNQTVQNGQRYTASYFWTYLELNQPDSAINFVDINYLKANPTVRQQIVNAAKTISAIHKDCLPKGSGTITYTDTTNVVSVYYTIPPTPKFALWLSFRQGDKNSLITHIVFKNEQQLTSDRKKYNQKDNSKPPKTPPPTVR